ncbi:MAG: YraN family protein [Clostridia bacterium]|nr:YraN family protein [Clostridia bacterium]
MKHNNKLLGRYGEILAALLLKLKGYRIQDRNYRNSFGELDIIAQKGKTLVFVEVKTRSSKRFGQAAEAVGAQKQERIRRLATAYLRHRGKDLYHTELRFDVIEVYPLFHVQHIKSCF